DIMSLFGSTRSRVERNHALICPDSFVTAPLPGWERTQGVILISPQLGARFTQYLALMEPAAVAAPAPPGVERVVYVMDGEVSLQMERAAEQQLTAGGYAYLPPNARAALRARSASRLNVFEKRYVALPGQGCPRPLLGREQHVEGVPFLGDRDALLQT